MVPRRTPINAIVSSLFSRLDPTVTLPTSKVDNFRLESPHNSPGIPGQLRSERLFPPNMRLGKQKASTMGIRVRHYSPYRWICTLPRRVQICKCSCGTLLASHMREDGMNVMFWEVNGPELLAPARLKSRRDSNPQPCAPQAPALPLSYTLKTES